MKNVLLHASKNAIVEILDVTSEKCALSISCQMFQLENGSALLVDSKINNFQYFQTKNWKKLPMSSKFNFSAEEQNLVTQLSLFFGLQKLLLYDDGRCRGVKCRHFPGFTALSHLAIATKISHSYHFHPTTTNIPHNHQSWENEDKKWQREVIL